jgi:hypothetical protein
VGCGVTNDDRLLKLYTNLINIQVTYYLRGMRWVGHVVCMEEITSVHKILFGKSKGKRPLGRPRCGQGDNIKMDLREIVWSGVH